MRRLFLALLFLLGASSVASAQIASEIANGGGGGVSTAVGSGTAGRIPQFVSASSLADSKMLASGTNSGTWTLYDSTGTSGRTLLAIREGESDVNSGNYLLQFVSWGGSSRGGVVAGINEINVRADRYDDATNNNFSLTAAGGLYLIDTLGVQWANGSYYNTRHLGLVPSASGILRVTDGSTGFGSLRSGNLGVETANAAVTNVSTISESITLAAAATTDSTADLCPANSIILSVTWRITSDITGVTSTTLSVGDPTTAARFGTGTVFTAGTTGIGITHMSGASTTAATGPTQGTAAKLRLTLSGGGDNTPSGGVVRVTVTYLSLTPPTS